MLAIYGKKPNKPEKGNSLIFEYPSADVAIDLNGQVVRCQFCNSRVQLTCDIPLNIKTHVKIVKQKKFEYNGNYNPKHPDSIKSMNELKKYIGLSSSKVTFKSEEKK